MSSRITISIAACCLATVASAEVTFERLLNAADEPYNWLNYSGTYDNQRYSRLDQVTRQNVDELELQWIWQARSLEKFEATPLVVDGILYTVQAPNDIVALDAATGRVFWTFNYENLPEARACCGRVNRGLAIHGETLFMGTIDAHLVAVDAISGQLKWREKVAEARDFYSITMSPLVVEDKVFIGTGGGDGGANGVIAAYDVETGRELWRFHTIPRPGEPGNERDGLLRRARDPGALIAHSESGSPPRVGPGACATTSRAESAWGSSPSPCDGRPNRGCARSSS